MLTNLDFVKEEMLKIPQLRLVKFKEVVIEGLLSFSKKIFRSVEIILSNRVILFFSLLQVIVLIFGYLLWLFFVSMIPGSLTSENSLLNYIAGVWCLGILGLVSFPIGILTGSIGIAYFYRDQRLKPSVKTCLTISLTYYKYLWIFSWIDSVVTFEQIIDRFPTENDEKTISEVAIKEFFYFAWKVATLGIYPSILNGRNLVEAGKESLSLVRNKFMDVVLLRAGYSAFSWVIGLACYIFFFLYMKPLTNSIYEYSLSVFGPFVIAVSVVLIFLRPIYIISSFALYSEFIKINKIVVNKEILLQNKYKIFAILFLIIFTMLIALLILLQYSR